MHRTVHHLYFCGTLGCPHLKLFETGVEDCFALGVASQLLGLVQTEVIEGIHATLLEAEVDVRMLR